MTLNAPKQRRNRKISDEQVIRMNNLGISLTTIAGILGCHPTAITARLKTLKIAPMDTRRAFMETIYSDLTEAQQAWVAELVGTETNIREFVKSLIVDGYERDKINV
jgi:predicted transcriptional regulator